MTHEEKAREIADQLFVDLLTGGIQAKNPIFQDEIVKRLAALREASQSADAKLGAAVRKLIEASSETHFYRARPDLNLECLIITRENGAFKSKFKGDTLDAAVAAAGGGK